MQEAIFSKALEKQTALCKSKLGAGTITEGNAVAKPLALPCKMFPLNYCLTDMLNRDLCFLIKQFWATHLEKEVFPIRTPWQKNSN